MKIAHVYWFGPKEPGGISNMLVDELTHYPPTIDAEVVYLEDCDPEYRKRFPKDVKITTLNRRKGSHILSLFYALFKLNIYLRRSHPDVVIFHDMRFSKYVFGGAFKRIGRIHNTAIDLSWFDKGMDLYVAISEAVKADAVARAGLDANKVEVVYNGVDLAQFNQKNTLNRPQNDVFRIVQVSRLSIVQKAQDLALRALRVCMDEHGLENWSYTLIGTGEDESLLRSLAKELGIEEKVFFAGQLSRTDIYQGLHEYDLFLLPSHYEGFGNVIVEALAAGVPVLCSDLDGPAEILKNQMYGSVFKAGSIDACSFGIYKIWTEYGTDVFVERTHQAAVYVRSVFDASMMTEALLKRYRTCSIE